MPSATAPVSAPARVPLDEGKSYGDIVRGQFRKNKVAVVCLWIVLILFLSAIFTPFLANDKPLYLRATFPGLYAKMFREWKFGAHTELVGLPKGLQAARQKWEKGEANLKEFKAELKPEDWHVIGLGIEGCQRTILERNPSEFKWKTGLVTVKEVLAAVAADDDDALAVREKALGEDSSKALAPIREKVKAARDAGSDAEVKSLLSGMVASDVREINARIERLRIGLSELYSKRKAAALEAIALKLDFLAEQVPADVAATAREAVREYRTLTANDEEFFSEKPEAAESLKGRLNALKDRTAAALDVKPEALLPVTRWPLLRSLHGWDVFFLTLTLTALVLVPTAGLLLKLDLRPRQSRFRIRSALLLVPPCLAGALWALRPAHTDIVNYKAGLVPDADGRTAIQAEKVILPPVFYGMNEDHLADKFRGPCWRESKEENLPVPRTRNVYWLGTDENGRDLLTRLLWGGRISLTVGFVAVGIYTVIGIVLGSLAGYYRGATDMAISRVIEWVICVPTFFLVLAVVALLPPSIYNIMIVIGLTGWTVEARLVRGEFLRLGNQDFVIAARALGVPAWRIIFRHILPNALAPVMVAASFGVAGAILTESGLSFLGLGVPIPDTSWGSVLSTARANPDYWWMITFPGFLIFLTVAAYNLVGEAMRDAIDPRLKI
ncbi:MAG: ABC transporter permease [Planctomycetes bacterium]|nr:ABC transporter permease [Planctomycetota bacterium]